ncbi:c-type cytochrome [Sphingobacterium sp. SYP-B4668]|uniref:c-type cytochrome n=1 Tax=Sphingobacterium sp. SYP-B4668 TaxID=2996035 RepID=UPI0022DE6A1C|nr:c-type cytochrome [Sphingobacterium sp. SYP-B4668]
MIRFKKTIIVVAVFITAITLLAFIPTQHPTQEKKATNLKVLPKNISNEELDKVMDEFKVALGVKCNFCHAKSVTDPKRMDFASDENPHKEVARSMMKMTMQINKKHFKHRDEKTGQIAQISCMTCHNGKEHPYLVSK